MRAWQFCKSLYISKAHGLTPFVSMQPHYNLLYREEEREMLGLCREEGVAVLPWSPLARGKLARPWEDTPSTERAKTDEFGKQLYGKTKEADRVIVDRVSQLAETRKTPRSQIALAWILSKPGITAPIVGASKPGHLEDAIAALSLKLSQEEITFLEEAYVPHPVLGFS